MNRGGGSSSQCCRIITRLSSLGDMALHLTPFGFAVCVSRSNLPVASTYGRPFRPTKPVVLKPYAPDPFFFRAVQVLSRHVCTDRLPSRSNNEDLSNPTRSASRIRSLTLRICLLTEGIPVNRKRPLGSS